MFLHLNQATQLHDDTNHRYHNDDNNGDLDQLFFNSDSRLWVANSSSYLHLVANRRQRQRQETRSEQKQDQETTGTNEMNYDEWRQRTDEVRKRDCTPSSNMSSDGDGDANDTLPTSNCTSPIPIPFPKEDKDKDQTEGKRQEHHSTDDATNVTALMQSVEDATGRQTHTFSYLLDSRNNSNGRFDDRARASNLSTRSSSSRSSGSGGLFCNAHWRRETGSGQFGDVFDFELMEKKAHGDDAAATTASALSSNDKGTKKNESTDEDAEPVFNTARPLFFQRAKRPSMMTQEQPQQQQQPPQCSRRASRNGTKHGGGYLLASVTSALKDGSTKNAARLTYPAYYTRNELYRTCSSSSNNNNSKAMRESMSDESDVEELELATLLCETTKMWTRGAG